MPDSIPASRNNSGSQDDKSQASKINPRSTQPRQMIREPEREDIMHARVQTLTGLDVYWTLALAQRALLHSDR